MLLTVLITVGSLSVPSPGVVLFAGLDGGSVWLETGGGGPSVSSPSHTTLLRLLLLLLLSQIVASQLSVDIRDFYNTKQRTLLGLGIQIRCSVCSNSKECWVYSFVVVYVTISRRAGYTVPL